MTTIEITAGEAKGVRPLPRCCIVCGAKPAKLVETQFALQAGRKWSVMTGHVSVMRYITTSLPLCKEHRTYFTSKQWQVLYAFGGVLAAFVVLLGIAICAGVLMPSGAVFVVAPVSILAFLGLFGFIGYMIFMTKSGVHPLAIKQYGIRLANVDERFAEELEALREEHADTPDDEIFEEFTDDGPRPRRRIQQDDEEDDDRRRRRR